MRIVLIILLILLIIAYIIKFAYKKLLFYPTHTNKKWEYPHKDYYVYKDGRYTLNKPVCDDYINCWHFNNFEGSKTILYFHGNYGNITEMDRMIVLCNRYRLNMLIVDYHGYGKSDGTPSYNIIDDGLRAYDFLVKFVHPSEIIIWGESMGGAVACYTAMNRKCRCLILLSTFSCLNDIAKYGKFNKYESICKVITSFTTNLCNKDWLKNVKCPVLIAHSKEDTLINFRCSQINFKSIKHNMKEFVEISGDHSTPHIEEEQYKKILDFCDFYHTPERMKEMLKYTN